MTDIKLDDSYDLWWENGEIDTISGSDEILQAVWIALSTGRGEWSWDTSFGFPYRQVTARRGASIELIEGAVRSTIEPIVGEGGVRAVEVTLDAASRVASIRVDTVYGEVTVP